MLFRSLGVVAISVIGAVAFRQRLDPPAMLGLALIVGGVVVIQLFSKSMAH